MQPLTATGLSAASSVAPSLSSSSTSLKLKHSFASRPATSASSSSSVPFLLDPPKKKQTSFLRKSKDGGESGVSSGLGKARCIWVGLPKTFLSLYDFEFKAGGAQPDFERLHANRDFAQAAEVLEGYMCVCLSPSTTACWRNVLLRFAVRRRFGEDSPEEQSAATQLVVYCLQTCTRQMAPYADDAAFGTGDGGPSAAPNKNLKQSTLGLIAPLVQRACDGVQPFALPCIDLPSLRTWSRVVACTFYYLKAKYALALSWARRALKHEVRQGLVAALGAQVGCCLSALSKSEEALQCFKSSAAILQTCEGAAEQRAHATAMIVNAGWQEMSLLRYSDAMRSSDLAFASASTLQLPPTSTLMRCVANLSATAAERCAMVERVPLERVPTRRSSSTRPVTPLDPVMRSVADKLSWGSGSPSWTPPCDDAKRAAGLIKRLMVSKGSFPLGMALDIAMQSIENRKGPVPVQSPAPAPVSFLSGSAGRFGLMGNSSSSSIISSPPRSAVAGVGASAGSSARIQSPARANPSVSEAAGAAAAVVAESFAPSPLPTVPAASYPSPSSSRPTGRHEPPLPSASNPSMLPSSHGRQAALATAPASAGHGLRARNTTRMRASGGALVKGNHSDDGGSQSSARLQQQVRSSSSSSSNMAIFLTMRSCF